jgi:hypothetical protein
MHEPPRPYGLAAGPAAPASGAASVGARGFERPPRPPPWIRRIRHAPMASSRFVPDSTCLTLFEVFAHHRTPPRQSARLPSTAGSRGGRRQIHARRDARPRPWRKTRHVAGVGRSPPACLPESDQADRRARPLARRADRIARPARVRIRSRKPWVFERRRLFGWKVRLLTSGTPSSSCSPHVATMCQLIWVDPGESETGVATSRSGCHREVGRGAGQEIATIVAGEIAGRQSSSTLPAWIEQPVERTRRDGKRQNRHSIVVLMARS